MLAPAPSGCHIVEAVVDSGAEQSVVPPGIFPGTVRPSAMSLSGRAYRAANGSRIKNLGEMDLLFHTESGQKCGLPVQVAEVERPLIAASQLGAAGNKVELEDHGGSIIHKKSGRTIPLQRKGGVYILRMYISHTSVGASSFPRLAV